MPAYPMRTPVRSQPKWSGFQRPQQGGSKNPVPANDNWRPSRPANDNVPTRNRFAKSVFKLGLATPLRYLNLGQNLVDMARGYYGLDSPPIGWNTNGWTLIRSCPKIPQFVDFPGLAASGTQPDLGCLTLQARTIIESEGLIGHAPGGGNANSALFWQRNPIMPAVRYDLARHYNASPLPNSGANAYLKAPHWSFMPFHLPVSPLANPNPNALPIGQFVPLARPLPYASQAAANASKERQQEKILPNPLAVPREVPQEVILPVHPLSPQPGARIQVYPVQKALPGKHRTAPPPSRTKERKFILAPNQNSPIGLLVNAVTETNDFVTALYFAIPANIRPREKTLQGKALAVYRHFGQIDVGRAINNLLQNQIGDAIGGVTGRITAKYNRTFNRPTSGFQAFKHIPKF